MAFSQQCINESIRYAAYVSTCIDIDGRFAPNLNRPRGPLLASSHSEGRRDRAIEIATRTLSRSRFGFSMIHNSIYGRINAWIVAGLDGCMQLNYSAKSLACALHG
jgi:hypothetical protein